MKAMKFLGILLLLAVGVGLQAAKATGLVALVPAECRQLVRIDCTALDRVPELKQILQSAFADTLPGDADLDQLDFKEIVACSDNGERNWVLIRVPADYDPIKALNANGISCRQLENSASSRKEMQCWELSAANESIKLASCRLQPEVLLCGDESDVADYLGKTGHQPSPKMLKFLQHTGDADLAAVAEVPKDLAGGEQNEMLTLAGNFLKGGALQLKLMAHTGSKDRAKWYQTVIPQFLAMFAGMAFSDQPEMMLALLGKLRCQVSGNITTAELTISPEVLAALAAKLGDPESLSAAAAN